MELISPLLRNDFREFCVTYLILRQIDDIFTMAGIKCGSLPKDRLISGQRRTLVEQYYASLNWHNQSDADKFLKVLGYAIAQQYSSEEPRNILRGFCKREDLIVDGINVYRKSGKPPVSRRVVVSPTVLAELKTRLIDLNEIDAHQRGFDFEKFLKDLFEAHDLAPRNSFRLVGEQIDGSFQFGSDVYLLEAKWQAKPTAQDDLLIFQGKVESKSTWTRGLFISNSGFSSDGLIAFARGRATNIIGMSGQDLYFIVSGEISFIDAIEKKARRAAETGEFFVPVFDLIRG
jgi:hypothetical protein